MVMERVPALSDLEEAAAAGGQKQLDVRHSIPSAAGVSTVRVGHRRIACSFSRAVPSTRAWLTHRLLEVSETPGSGLTWA